MKTKRFKLHIDDKLLEFSRNMDMILCGVEVAKTADDKQFERALEKVISLVVADEIANFVAYARSKGITNKLNDTTFVYALNDFLPMVSLNEANKAMNQSIGM